ncbi:uncharacterized protein LOC106069288 isoform X2 [Biomphalaria glabrata]|uniref:Uncharacterized protein LOC106069288 isoform X2 n=1 Tax=Biomphalaria glabrata TaxID=6526 RepID=A0A9W3AW02_BIOGL|nr:uncharacterized protein LOC106069288 isoform X2 [Biomphalaria glabrata]
MMEESVMEAVRKLDCDLFLSLIPDSSQQPRLSLELMRTLFFVAVDSLVQASCSGMQSARIVYLLRNLGAQINRQNEDGNTPLMCYMKAGNPDSDIVEAFLRCNADIYIANKLGEFPLEYVMTSSHVTPVVRGVFTRYVPGIWEAVAKDDAMSVRRLINEWCRVDVQKNGQTLLQLALEMGTENIIRVVSGIRSSMEFAHSVLAGDTQIVRRMLRLKLKINVNFRNLGDRGKTPIFYALVQDNTDLVHTLLDRGARVDITLKGEDEIDIPFYFAALEHSPPISTALLKTIIPLAPVKVDSLFYKGRNILFHCIEKNVGEQLVDYILSKSSPYLVTQRVGMNRCPREMAEERGCSWMIKAIDAAVVRWVYQEEGLSRQVLVLQGYQYIPAALQNINSNMEDDTDIFYRYLSLYQEQVNALHKAVEESDEETVRHIIYFRHPDDHSLDPCLADSRKPGDGQPLLHKAVLRGSLGVTQLLAETLVYQRKQRLDSVRDQYFRTALHYAYGLEDGKELVSLLLDYGASEFTMDKDNRSPLAFKDRQGQERMNELLQYQYLQDFTHSEPDPWSVPLPIPIIDYILNSCNHSDGHQGYLQDFTSHVGAHRHISSLPNTDIAVIQASSPGSPLTKSHKFRSVSDTKLHKLTPSKPSLAAHLANFPDAVKSRLTKRSNNKLSIDGLRKDYLPVPMDAPRDSEDDFEFEDDGADSRDLLDEKEMRKSTSCCLQ